MCSLFLSLGSVAVQNKESKMSCPKLENSLSAIYGKNKMSYTVHCIIITLYYRYLYVESSVCIYIFAIKIDPFMKVNKS